MPSAPGSSFSLDIPRALTKSPKRYVANDYAGARTRFGRARRHLLVISPAPRRRSARRDPTAPRVARNFSTSAKRYHPPTRCCISDGGGWTSAAR